MFSDGVVDMTTRWWELRLQYQGILPPVVRTERDFDPASKYHVPADLPYSKFVLIFYLQMIINWIFQLSIENIFFSYFVSVVLQFQLFESLCDISGHTGELHTCDLYRSREAGRLLS